MFLDNDKLHLSPHTLNNIHITLHSPCLKSEDYKIEQDTI